MNPTPVLTRWPVAWLAPALFLVWGCGGMAMGQGTMHASSADDAKEVDAPLAVGGSIQPDVRLDFKGTASPTLAIVSARPEVASASGGRLTGHAPGVTAILVTNKEGAVLDFYHLWVEAASRATLHRVLEDGQDVGELMDGIDMLVGESVRLTPKVYYEAQELAGVVPGQWSVEPPIADVLREGMADRRRIVARRPGSATLSVQVANVKVAVPLRVLASPRVRLRGRPIDRRPPPAPLDQPAPADDANEGGAP